MSGTALLEYARQIADGNMDDMPWVHQAVREWSGGDLAIEFERAYVNQPTDAGRSGIISAGDRLCIHYAAYPTLIPLWHPHTPGVTVVGLEGGQYILNTASDDPKSGARISSALMTYPFVYSLPDGGWHMIQTSGPSWTLMLVRPTERASLTDVRMVSATLRRTRIAAEPILTAARQRAQIAALDRFDAAASAAIADAVAPKAKP